MSFVHLLITYLQFLQSWPYFRHAQHITPYHNTIYASTPMKIFKLPRLPTWNCPTPVISNLHHSADINLHTISKPTILSVSQHLNENGIKKKMLTLTHQISRKRRRTLLFWTKIVVRVRHSPNFEIHQL